MLSAIGFIPVTQAYDGGTFSFWNLYGPALIGLGVTFLLVAITEYYTGTRWAVKRIAEASQTGHATNIISGLAVGMQATALPVVVIAAGIIGATAAGKAYGIGVAVMAQLSMTGLIVLDAYGPSPPRAGSRRWPICPVGPPGHGSARRCRQRRRPSPRATRSARLAAGADPVRRVRARTAGTRPQRRHLNDPWVIAGSLIGGLMPFLFACSDAGRRTGRRRGGPGGPPPVPREPGDHGDTSRPDYSRAIGIVTGSAIKEMMVPALIPIVIPITVGIIKPEMLGGLLIGTIVTGLFLAIAMTSGGGAWDNAEEVDRGRPLRRQGLGGPRSGGHRRHGRRPTRTRPGRRSTR